MNAPRLAGGVACLLVGSLLLAGCVAKTEAATADALTVDTSDSACSVSAASATSGTLAFDVSVKPTPSCVMSGSASR